MILWQRAHISASVTADLGFHRAAAQRNPRKLAPQRVGHAPGREKSCDAGRAHEARIGPFSLFFSLMTPETPAGVLHLGQTVVLLIENARGCGEINFVFVDRPRQMTIQSR